MARSIAAFAFSFLLLAGSLLTGAVLLSASVSTTADAGRHHLQCWPNNQICIRKCSIQKEGPSCAGACRDQFNKCMTDSTFIPPNPKNPADAHPGTSPPRAPLNKRPGAIGGGTADPGASPTKSRNPVAKGNYQKATPVIQRRNR